MLFCAHSVARAPATDARPAQTASCSDASACVGSSYGRCDLRGFDDSAGCPQDAINDMHRRLRGRECTHYLLDGLLHRRVDGPHLWHAAGIFLSYRAHLSGYSLAVARRDWLSDHRRCRVAVWKGVETDRSLLPAARLVYCVRQRNILDNFRADGARNESDGSGCAGGGCQRSCGQRRASKRQLTRSVVVVG